MSKDQIKIGIIGSGSWATAMIKMLSDNELSKSILWWMRKEDDRNYVIRHKHNPSYLSAVEIHLQAENISTDARTVISEADIVILNTPSTYLKQALSAVTAKDFENKIVVSAIKGIVPEENVVVGKYLMENYHIPLDNIVAVGGPCHAEEVTLEKLSYLTIASSSKQNAKQVAQYLQTHYINTIISDDLIGLEYAAVLKNIYALAGGICHGLGYGDNFQAVLVSNAIREMEDFLKKINPSDRNINDSAYLGDLLVTAYSQFSRNRTFGNMIGKGYNVQSAQLEMNMIAEGYYAAGCIEAICNRRAIQLPICQTVYRIIYEHRPAILEIKLLAEKLT